MAAPILAGLLSGPLMRLLAVLAVGAVVVMFAPDLLDAGLAAAGDAAGAIGGALEGAVDGLLDELASRLNPL